MELGGVGQAGGHTSLGRERGWGAIVRVHGGERVGICLTSHSQRKAVRDQIISRAYIVPVTA